MLFQNLDSLPLNGQHADNFVEKALAGDFGAAYMRSHHIGTATQIWNNQIDQEQVGSSSFESRDDRSDFDLMYGEQYPCKEPDWDKTFKDEASLRKHVLTHSEKMFTCPVKGCGKKFLDNSKLKRHRLVHSGVKKFRCHIWGKKFSLDFNLRTHIRTHTGERPYVCEFYNCGKRFTQSSNLTAHLKTHSWNDQIMGNSKTEASSQRAKKQASAPSVAQDSCSEIYQGCNSPSGKKIFQISRVRKENLLLMRNKIPKVFHVQKCKPQSLKSGSSSRRSYSDCEDTPIRKVWGDIFKIERFENVRKRPFVRSWASTKIQPKVANEYSANVMFKIEKVPRDLATPLSMMRLPLKSTADIDSSSTKRSSRESSKHKLTPVVENATFNIEPINLLKVENEDMHDHMHHASLPYESELFLMSKNKNEELQREIQDFAMSDQLQAELVNNPALEKLHKQMELESISSYYEDEFYDVYNEVPVHRPIQTIEFKRPHFRPRGVSMWNDFNVLEDAENTSFLLGSERETPNFEPFATKQLFSRDVSFENK